ncbi:MAG TPA: hypothetical protein VIF02_16625 [Methylocella sp.]|jgi:hypothetical protein
MNRKLAIGVMTLGLTLFLMPKISLAAENDKIFQTDDKIYQIDRGNKENKEKDAKNEEHGRCHDIRDSGDEHCKPRPISGGAKPY